jgi:UDP-N-acetylmuramate: L-alanyl-gamma-D-glutamyl-meso-diaminopimelate ligase
LTRSHGESILAAALKVHFIGIAGTGMGALARLLVEAGHEVRGSDTGVYPPMSDQLAAAGIPVATEYGAANLQWAPDRVVVGNICRADHPEVVAARAAGIELESFPSMLAKALLPERRSLVVAGTHGKTTTTSLLAWILQSAGHEPSWLVGGVPLNLGSGAHLGTGDALVLEGDEYDTSFFDKKSKFLHYRPQRAILTSVEFDHADIFASLDDVREAFAAFVATIPADGDLIVNMESADAMGIASQARCRVIRYRVLPDRSTDTACAEYTAAVRSRPGARRTTFEMFERGQSLGEFSTQLLGRFNLGNVLAASAVARAEGVEVEALRDALRRFRGVRKRQELLGLAQGVRVIFDFAHHPTAAQLTVTATRKRYPEGSLHVCFEPRSSSSHRATFADGFAGSFDAATHVYVAPLHRPEKVPPAERLDPAGLARAIGSRGVDARAFDTIDALQAAVLERAKPGDTVLLLSSGSFHDLGPRLLFALGDPVVFAEPADMVAVNRLLAGYDIPEVISSPQVETLVVRSDPASIVGAVSLQLSGPHAFLFGLAVTPERRGEGLGWILGDCMLRRCRTLGVSTVTLLTTSAADFFATKLGFSQVDIDGVDPDLRDTANFRANAAESAAVCMQLALPRDA